MLYACIRYQNNQAVIITFFYAKAILRSPIFHMVFFTNSCTNSMEYFRDIVSVSFYGINWDDVRSHGFT